MKFDKGKLLNLKGNIDRYLKKLETEEKNRYEKLALSFTNSKASIEEILDAIKNDKTYEKSAILLEGLRQELNEIKKGSQDNFDLLSNSIQQLASVFKEKPEFNDRAIISALNRLEKLLAKKEKPTKDKTEEIIKAVKGIEITVPKIEFPNSISIDNFPPQKVPNPVTNININPLRGDVHSSSTTVGTTKTQLPDYGVLENRRALIFYNNGSKTVFIGGSDVTKDNGIPVLANTFSPSFDSGPRQIWYGVVESGTSEVRAIEISNDAGA